MRVLWVAVLAAGVYGAPRGSGGGAPARAPPGCTFGELVQSIVACRIELVRRRAARSLFHGAALIPTAF
jgi:hypothetical protein